MEIEVVEMRPINKGSLRAFVAIRVGGMLVRDCRVIQQSEQTPWVSPPQQSYEVGGEKKWKAIVEFPRELKKSIEERILAHWRAQVDAHPSSDAGADDEPF